MKFLHLTSLQNLPVRIEPRDEIVSMVEMEAEPKTDVCPVDFPHRTRIYTKHDIIVVLETIETIETKIAEMESSPSVNMTGENDLESFNRLI